MRSITALAIHCSGLSGLRQLCVRTAISLALRRNGLDVPIWFLLRIRTCEEVDVYLVKVLLSFYSQKSNTPEDFALMSNNHVSAKQGVAVLSSAGPDHFFISSWTGTHLESVPWSFIPFR